MCFSQDFSKRIFKTESNYGNCQSENQTNPITRKNKVKKNLKMKHQLLDFLDAVPKRELQVHRDEENKTLSQLIHKPSWFFLPWQLQRLPNLCFQPDLRSLSDREITCRWQLPFSVNPGYNNKISFNFG